MTEQPDQEPEYALSMPFVLVQSAGGPYEDVAFVAGYALGGLDTELGVLSTLPGGLPALPAPRMIETDILPQVDLIAMQHGYILASHEPVKDQEDWTWVVFAREEEPR